MQTIGFLGGGGIFAFLAFHSFKAGAGDFGTFFLIQFFGIVAWVMFGRKHKLKGGIQ